MNPDEVLRIVITAVNQVGPGVNAARRDLQQFYQSAQSGAQQFGTVLRRAGEQASAFAGAVASAAARAGAAMETALRRAGNAARAVAGQFAGVGTALGRLGQAATVATTVVGGGLVAGFVAMAKTGIEFNLTLEGAQQTLTRMTGSSRVAAQIIAELRKEAATSSLTFSQMLPVAQSLAAAYGPQGIGKVIPTMRAFADAATALKVPNEGLQQALLGFRQLIRPGGSISQEELNQITENLPGVNVTAALTEAFGTADLDTIRAAGVTGEQVGTAIVAGMQRSFGGAQAALAGTLPVILPSFIDAWENLAAKVTQTFLPMLTQAMQKLLAVFQKLSENEKFIALLEVPFTVLGRVLEWVGDHAEELYDWIVRISNAEGLKVFLSSVIGLAQTVGETLNKVFGVDLAAWLAPERLNNLFGTLFRWMVHTASAAFGIGRAFDQVKRIVQGFVRDTSDRIADLAEDMALAMQAAFYQITAAAQLSLAQILGTILKIIDGLNRITGLGGPKIPTAGLQAAQDAAIAGAAGAAAGHGLIGGQQAAAAGRRAARERAKDLADPLRHLPITEQLRRAYETPDAAERDFMARLVVNARRAYQWMFGDRTAAAGAAGIPRSIGPVGSLGGNVNPAPPMLRGTGPAGIFGGGAAIGAVPVGGIPGVTRPWLPGEVAAPSVGPAATTAGGMRLIRQYGSGAVWRRGAAGGAPSAQVSIGNIVVPRTVPWDQIGAYIQGELDREAAGAFGMQGGGP